jgi:putative transcriptional regulator
MGKTYKSDAMAAVHDMMEGFHQSGAIDKQTMREFDEACLTAISTLTPDEIRALREREHLSQPVFARYLNVSKNLVSDWERGVKKPGGPALRLLTVVKKKGLQAIA